MPNARKRNGWSPCCVPRCFPPTASPSRTVASSPLRRGGLQLHWVCSRPTESAAPLAGPQPRGARGGGGPRLLRAPAFQGGGQLRLTDEQTERRGAAGRSTGTEGSLARQGQRPKSPQPPQASAVGSAIASTISDRRTTLDRGSGRAGVAGRTKVTPSPRALCGATSFCSKSGARAPSGGSRQPLA